MGGKPQGTGEPANFPAAQVKRTSWARGGHFIDHSAVSGNSRLTGPGIYAIF